VTVCFPCSLHQRAAFSCDAQQFICDLWPLTMHRAVHMLHLTYSNAELQFWHCVCLYLIYTLYSLLPVFHILNDPEASYQNFVFCAFAGKCHLHIQGLRRHTASSLQQPRMKLVRSFETSEINHEATQHKETRLNPRPVSVTDIRVEGHCCVPSLGRCTGLASRSNCGYAETDLLARHSQT
jgi:hypothetical protein